MWRVCVYEMLFFISCWIRNLIFQIFDWAGFWKSIYIWDITNEWNHSGHKAHMGNKHKYGHGDKMEVKSLPDYTMGVLRVKQNCSQPQDKFSAHVFNWPHKTFSTFRHFKRKTSIQWAFWDFFKMQFIIINNVNRTV